PALADVSDTSGDLWEMVVQEALQDPRWARVGSTIKEVITLLRKWQRWCARAALQIDVMPDDAKVDQLHAQMLSELEAAYHRSAKDTDKDAMLKSMLADAAAILHQSAVGVSGNATTPQASSVTPGTPGLEQVSVTLAGDERQSWYRMFPYLEQATGLEGCASECQALQLIEELEMSRLKELENQVQALEWKMSGLEKPIDPTVALRKFGESGSRKDALVAVFSQPYFKEVPDEVKVKLAEEIPRNNQTDGKKILKRLPLSRAARRSLYNSRKWIVQLCDGYDVSQDPIRVWGKEKGCEVLQIDLLRKGGKGWDLTKPEGVWSVLLWAAAEGRITCITSSAPRRTWQASISERDDHLARGLEFWGSGFENEKVLKENLLVVQDLFLWSLASVFRGGRIPLVKECSAGVERGTQGRDFWDTETWHRFEQWSGVKVGLVPVEDTKGKDIKYLSVGTNLEFPGWRPLKAVSSWNSASCWTLGFRSMIKGALSGHQPHEDLEVLDGIVTAALEGSKELTCKAGAVRAADRDLSPEEVEGWKAHIAQGHIPYRRDCLHRVQGSGLGIQHRKVKHPSSYSLSIDLFGPMAVSEKGQDEEAVSGIAQIKYGLMGAFRVPREVLRKEKNEGVEPASPGHEAEPVEPLEDLAEYEPSLPDEGLGLGSPVLEDVEDLFESSEVGARAFALHEDSEHPLPWKDEKIPTNDEELQEYLKGLMVPPDQAVLRFFIGLKSKTGVDVTSGIQKMILTIMKQFPVRTLHCDPGTEFTSDALKRWLSDQKITLQHPLPADKQANGLAERTIGWSKARARTLLSATGIPTQFWPLAIRYACETHNRVEKGESLLPAFGQQVFHKLKRTPTSAKDLMRRWVMTRYLAPHLTVPGGHVLLTDQGTLVASKGFRAGLVDPEVLEQARPPPLQELETEEDEAEGLVEGVPGVPLKRVRGKTSIRAVEYGNCQTEDLEVLSQRLVQEEDFSQQGFRIVAQKLQQCETAASGGRKVDFGGRFVFGAYCHGGLRGVTSLTIRRPWTSKYLTGFLRRLCEFEEEARWSSVMLMIESEVEPHKDFRNEWGTKNFVAHVPGTFDLKIVSDQEEGSTTCTLGTRAVSFDPRRVHSVQCNPGWFIAAYTPLGSGKIDSDKRDFLSELGFGFFKNEIAASVCAVSSGAASSSSPVNEGSQIQEVGKTEDPDLSIDEQPDSVTPLVGWDVNRGDDPPTVFEEADLATYLEERGVASELERLSEIGVQEAVDLQFIYIEDLVEAGIPEVSARRIMFGVHPEGTVRPDEPSTCALRTGEVRLYDRAQRQIPWVIQNRTLDFSRPPPPVQGIGMNEEFEIHPHPGHELFWGPDGPIDAEEEAGDGLEGPTEIKPDLPEESTASRVIPLVVDSADDPPCGSDEVPYSVSFSRFAFNNTTEEMMRLQSIWDAFDGQEVQQVGGEPSESVLFQEEHPTSTGMVGVTAQGSGVSNVVLEDSCPAEITDLPEESTASRVINFSCKALAVGGGH
ncbi:GIP, partial [Symbiodinium necroappetens]